MQETFPPAPGAPDIISGETELNLIVNSNRDFINQFAQIQNMDCASDPQPLTLNRICVQVSIQTTVTFLGSQDYGTGFCQPQVYTVT